MAGIAGDSWIATDEGLRQVSELVGKEIVRTPDGCRIAIEELPVQDAVEMHSAAGHSIKCGIRQFFPGEKDGCSAIHLDRSISLRRPEFRVKQVWRGEGTFDEGLQSLLFTAENVRKSSNYMRGMLHDVMLTKRLRAHPADLRMAQICLLRLGIESYVGGTTLAVRYDSSDVRMDHYEQIKPIPLFKVYSAYGVIANGFLIV